MGRGQRTGATRTAPKRAATASPRTAVVRQAQLRAAIEASEDALRYSNRTALHRLWSEERNERISRNKKRVVRRVAALDGEGLRLLHVYLDGRSGGAAQLLRLTCMFLEHNLLRAERRYEVLEERVEALPRLDRMLLAPAALSDRRPLHSLHVALRTQRASPAQIHSIGISRAPWTQDFDPWKELQIKELALAYQQGLPISGRLGYIDSRSTRHFCEQDWSESHAASGLPTRQAFGNLIIL